MKPSLMCVFGTRPEAIKMAPVVLALKEEQGLQVTVAVTGQHRQMLDSVLRLFGIVPDFDLDILQQRQTLTEITTRVLERLTPVVESQRPDMVIVQGDTTTTFVGALAAFYHRVAVAHVEAGLRTGDPYSPFPEEVNRRLTTRLTNLHLAPTPWARQNLLDEGIDSRHVVVTGNTVIDALRWAISRSARFDHPALTDLDEDTRPVLLVTIHRRETWGAPMVEVGKALAEIAVAEPRLIVVFPVHRNPVVREAVLPPVTGLPNVRVVEPLGYADFARLIARSTLVLTDSGGLQEEAPSLGKPVLVLRDTTERPEAVRAGTARLVGTQKATVRDAVLGLLHDPHAYAAMATAVNPYGDGRAAGRVIAAIRHYFGQGGPPEQFQQTTVT
jgi:UDP-N-acetylglucosamine 2-epimerase (non-hydrolysing)